MVEEYNYSWKIILIKGSSLCIEGTPSLWFLFENCDKRKNPSNIEVESYYAQCNCTACSQHLVLVCNSLPKYKYNLRRKEFNYQIFDTKVSTLQDLFEFRSKILEHGNERTLQKVNYLITRNFKGSWELLSGSLNYGNAIFFASESIYMFIVHGTYSI